MSTNNTDMVFKKEFFQLIFESIKKQGVPFLILLGVIIYMHTQVSDLQQQIISYQNKTDACNEQMINIYKEERKEMTKALNSLKEVVQLYIKKDS